MMDFILGIFKLYRERYDFFAELFIQHVLLSVTAISFITIIGLLLGICITRNKKATAVEDKTEKIVGKFSLKHIKDKDRINIRE